MDTLPNAQAAIIPADKLRYCLDPLHPTGKHKARVFESALGINLDNMPELERMLRDGIASHPARLRCTYTDGTERWVVNWVVLGRMGPLLLVCAWNRPRSDHCPRLVSCYLKKVK